MVRRGAAAEPVNDASFGGVVAGDLDLDSVAGEDPNVVLADFAGDVAEDQVLVIQANAEHAVRERLHDETLVHPLLLAGLVGLRGGGGGEGGRGREERRRGEEGEGAVEGWEGERGELGAGRCRVVTVTGVKDWGVE